MTVPPSVAAALLARAAASDNRTITEAAALAWAESLDDVVTVQDGNAAIAKHYARTRDFVMPSDINAGVKAIRAARNPGTAADALPDADPDDVAGYIAALRAGRMRIGNGDGPKRPVTQLVAQAASTATLPRDVVQGARRDVANETRR